MSATEGVPTLKAEGTATNGIDEHVEMLKAAVEAANPNALRLCLYQQTQDETLRRMQVSKVPVRGGAMMDYVLSSEDEATVRAATLDFLSQQRKMQDQQFALSNNDTQKTYPDAISPERQPEQGTVKFPDACELMRIYTGEDLNEANLRLGYEELAFQPFPRAVEWSAGKEPSAERLKHYRVAIIGAGINGISTAVHLQRLGIPYTLIDRQADVGGTWYNNTYPGARVDTLGFSFQYKFDEGYKWKETFPSGPELRTYLSHIARKYDVARNITFSRSVSAATWDEDSQMWDLTLTRTDVAPEETENTQEKMRVNAIINAGGLFASINLPDMEGLSDFQGHVFHTTKWDHSVQYEGKRIAVVGNGSSGAQLMPGLAEAASHLTQFQRTPQWIAPYAGYRSSIPESTHWLLDNLPNYRAWFGYGNFLRGMQLPPLQRNDLEWQKTGGLVNARNDGMRKGLTEYIKSKVGADSPLLPKLVPSYAPLVRRLVVDNGYYDALTRPNVDLVTTPIERFYEKGIKTTDGRQFELDLVVLACGFKPTEYLSSTHFVGRNGVTLDQTWAKDGARSYLGLVIPGYPNLYTLYGPNHQPRGGPSLHSWSEIWGRYAIGSIVWQLENEHQSVDVKQSVYDEYNKRLDAANSKLIWESEGKGYFVNKHGRQNVNMPWEADEYHPWVVKPNPDDFNVV